jgi:hypothetical protein
MKSSMKSQALSRGWKRRSMTRSSRVMPRQADDPEPAETHELNARQFANWPKPKPKQTRTIKMCAADTA